MSARNLNHAKAGSILASYLKMLPMGLMIMPGMISRVLFPGRTGEPRAPRNRVACGAVGGQAEDGMSRCIRLGWTDTDVV